MSISGTFKLNADWLCASVQRRDAGAMPMPWDNYVLRRAREPINMRLPRRAEEPPIGSEQARVLLMLREGPVSMERIRYALGCNELRAHAVVEGLRERAWWVEQTGPREFALVRQRAEAA